MVFSDHVADKTIAGVLQQGAYLHVAFVHIFLSRISARQFLFRNRGFRRVAAIFSVFDQLDQSAVRCLDLGVLLHRVGR